MPRHKIRNNMTRAFDVHTGCSVWCPTANADAEPGALMRVRISETEHVARFIGKVVWVAPLAEPEVSPVGMVVVLVISADFRSAYMRWVSPVDVLAVSPVPTNMAAWFFQPDLPEADVVIGLANYGTLNERYIADPKCGPQELYGRDGRASAPAPAPRVFRPDPDVDLEWARLAVLYPEDADDLPEPRDDYSTRKPSCMGKTWLEAEAFCEPQPGTRRALVRMPGGHLGLVKCGYPDTFFSIPVKGGGFIHSDDATGEFKFSPPRS